MRRHFSCAELFSVALGTASSRRRAEFLEHHAQLCSSCREELAHLEAACDGVENAGELARFSALISDTKLKRLALTESLAQREFRSLMRLPAASRRPRIARALSRFRSPALVDLLLEESRKRFTTDSWQSLALAECAQDVAMRVSHQEFGTHWAMTCLARAHVFRGNALRLIGDLRQADTAVSFGWTLFSQDGNGDPLVEGELLSMTASLRTDQGRESEAGELLERAIIVYGEIGDHAQVAKMLVQQSVVLHYALDFDGAIAASAKAISLLSREADPRLYLSAVHNYLWVLRQNGRCQEAWAGFQEYAPLYDQFDDAWTVLRRRWLEGTLLLDRGQPREAERLLKQVREGFLAQGHDFYGAVAGLDLAQLYLEQGRTEEVRQLAEQTVPVFLAQDLRRDAATAVFLFQESALRQTATTAMVQQLRAHLYRNRGGAARSPK